MSKKPDPVFVTQQKYNDLTAELKSLKAELPSLIKETGAMAALGDRSENAGYQNAKAKMRRTQRRIRYLERFIPICVVIKNKNLGVVDIGSKVTLKNVETNDLFTYTVVDSLEANPTKGYISFKSPIGKLVMGKKQGEKITLATPHLTSNYEVIKIQ
jgi:transcription elongation factor GreA